MIAAQYALFAVAGIIALASLGHSIAALLVVALGVRGPAISGEEA